MKKNVFIILLLSSYLPVLSPIFRLTIGSIKNNTNELYTCCKEDMVGNPNSSITYFIKPHSIIFLNHEWDNITTLKELQARPIEINKDSVCKGFGHQAQLLGKLRLYNDETEIIGKIVACIYEEMDTYVPVQGGEVELQGFFKTNEKHTRIINYPAWISDFKSDPMVEYILNFELEKDLKGQLSVKGEVQKNSEKIYVK